MKITTKNILILTVVIIILFIGYYNQKSEQSEVLNSASNFTLEMNDKSEKQSLADKNNEEIVIHLSGEVKKPGVYRLKNNQRLIDLIKAAGGLKDKADLDRINLAEKVFDGQKVIIPSLKDKNNSFDFTEVSESKLDEKTFNNFSNTDAELININQADQKSLESLSGIGPAKAKAIIKYREENSYFNKAEDLLKISGIGEKTLENIKNEITLK